MNTAPTRIWSAGSLPGERKKHMTQENYGVLSDGRQVTKYTIDNGILSMAVLGLGGINL